MELKAEQVRVASYWEWLELAYQRRWTDGLPVVPPTPDRVETMVAYLGRDPQEVVGEVPPSYGKATIEKLAVNSVMAGCLPEHFPVVVAAVEAMLDPFFNLNGVQTTTHGSEPLIIVHGPVVRELGFNTGVAVFGKGSRANATIGRAAKLALWNIGGSYPGEPDRTNFGHPGMWSFCIAENQDYAAPGWEPLHVERGIALGKSAVTVFSCEGPQTVGDYGAAKPILDAIRRDLRFMGQRMGQKLLVFNPEVANILSSQGWTKNAVRRYLWENTKVTVAELREPGSDGSVAGTADEYARMVYPEWIDMSRPDFQVPICPGPEDIMVLVTGGTGKITVCCTGWTFGGRAVTREIPQPAGRR
ncbi:MAG: hypothetical protein HYY00_00480 [Chloroflexi bacterium]|nr:hypothetical protein [Chloroflexota bacterium]